MCAQLYMDQSKKFFDHFICFWKWFLTFFVFIFSAYFVSHYLSINCVEKQVSEILATHSEDLQVARPSHEFWLLILATCKPRGPVTRLHKMSWWLTRDSSVAKRPELAFSRAFLWETCFKPLSSSFKPHFSIFLHQNSINLNGFSFH